jgi:uncharacterized protein
VVSARGVYVDASALVKLVLPEPETPALRTYLAESGPLLSSRVAHVEVRRAVARVARPGDEEHVAELLARLQTIELDDGVGQIAAAVSPSVLRSLDAIHVASALSIREELDAFITYDRRLADAARAAGLNAEAPA